MSRELLRQAFNYVSAYIGDGDEKADMLHAALQAELAKPPIEPIFCLAETADSDGNPYEFHTAYPLPESLRAAGWKVKTLFYAGEPPTKKGLVLVPEAKVSTLTAALKEAQKDAARYRLAKRAYHAQSPQMDGTFHFSYCIGDVRLPRALNLDAAFDAAIAQEKS